VGDWPTVGALITVAVITAATTDRRLTRQIAADAARQERDLAAEAERQRATLAHDRELADLAGLRMLLDEAAVALDAGEAARGSLQVAFAEHGRNVDKAELDEGKACGQALFALRERLRIRVGTEHLLARGFSEAALALLKTWSAISGLSVDDSPEALETCRAIVRASRTEYEHGFAGFTRAAVVAAGVASTSAPDLAPGTRTGTSGLDPHPRAENPPCITSENRLDGRDRRGYDRLAGGNR
jgi:hypothetical protein